MKFLKKKCPSDITQSYKSASGSRKKKVYSPFFDGKRLTLIESGEIDIQNEINSHAAECDLSLILTRLKNGDLSGLRSDHPVFTDFRNLPTNFREMIDVALRAESDFNALSPDIRQKFNNDYRQFVSRADTEEWHTIMSALIPNQDVAKEDASND